MISNYYDKEYIKDAVSKGRHRQVTGREWDVKGRLQFQLLRDYGLLPHMTLLDIGCGCLCGGIHFIKYLKKGNYYGTDINQCLLDAGYNIELKKLNFQHKLPREKLFCNGEFNFFHFKKKFDFAIAQSVFSHLPLNHIRFCIERLTDIMKPKGKFFATFFKCPNGKRTDSSIIHSSGYTKPVVTTAINDPYHYRVDDFQFACKDLPWKVEYIGEWGYPGHQEILLFHFIQ